MKTKNKMLALLEIVIVLCSVLLVTLPAIAADQTMQEVSPSANTITTVSEDDYVLDIYGNANEDDTIDMRDLTYVKLIFFGKKPETELADAKYDDKINPLDFIQIKLIIVGKEKELTIAQYMGSRSTFTEEPVTVPMPIERIVAVGGSYGPETFCSFGVRDRLVGVAGYAQKTLELKTCLEDIPSIGSSFTWDMEKIMELKPDIVVAYAYRSYPDYEKQLNAAGIPLVQMDFYIPKKYSREIRNMGYMLDKKERAEELINFEQEHLGLIEERVNDLEKEQKPRVYYEHYKDYWSYPAGSSNHNTLIACGGINIFADISSPKTQVEIDPEVVIERNPQVIIKLVSKSSVPSGYGVTDTGPMEELRNAIMSRPGWDHLDAVKKGRVYLINSEAKSTHSSVFDSYMAKFVHPDLFEDIDPVDIHSDWFQKFLGIEYKGMYAYPTYPVS